MDGTSHVTLHVRKDGSSSADRTNTSSSNTAPHHQHQQSHQHHHLWALSLLPKAIDPSLLLLPMPIPMPVPVPMPIVWMLTCKKKWAWLKSPVLLLIPGWMQELARFAPTRPWRLIEVNRSLADVDTHK